MQLKSRKKILRLGIAVVMAFVFTYSLSTVVFEKNSPLVRKDLLENINNQTTNLLVKLGWRQTEEETTNEIEITAKIADGVYAAQKDGQEVRYINTGEMKFIEYEYEIDGRVVRIRVPESERPLSQQEAEKFFEQ